jgi:hypothetical protein
LEYLGIACPNGSMQFEDYLEELRRSKSFEHRGDYKSRQKLATEVGAKCEQIEINSNERNVITSKLKGHLEKGHAVLISAFSSPKGHIVRLQAITDDGLIVDDPYGKVQNFTERENGGFGYSGGKNSTDDSAIQGSNNLWTWADVADTIIKYAEIYSLD